MSGRHVHRTGTWVLSIAMVAIGIALAVEAILGGVISMRLLLALLFLAAGSGRIYIEVRRGRA